MIVAEQSLLERLGVGIGGTLSIGDATVTIGGILGTQPDRLADRLAYGPRVLMSLETLDRTGLIQPGSLIRWIYRLKLPEPRGNDKTALNTTRFTIEAKFPESGFAINDWTDPAPSIRREVKRFTQFISLVGLTALLLGGIGVGNAIGSYMAKKRGVIATFKTLGASSRLVLAVYLIQALMLAGIGIVIGLVLGALTPALLSATYGEALPIALAVEPHPLSLLTAAGAGLLTMLLFVLLPLGPRQSRAARRADALASHRRAGAAAACLHRHRCRGRTCALCPRHRRVRGARHHALHLRRHRRRLSPAARLRLAVAEACRALPPHQAAGSGRSRSRASQALARSRGRSRSRSGSASASSSPSP